MENTEREHRSIVAINLGLGVNIVLAILKTTIGIIGHSPALLADGVNSTSDVAYYIVVRIFVGLARKPADEDHPYGHRQFESIAALIVGAFVMTTAVTIFWDSINQVYELWSGQGDYTGASSLTLVVALLTIATKIVLTSVTQRIGRQTQNAAISALAYDHRNDIFASAAASVGIFFGRMGFLWVDPLAGAVVALVILNTGLKILRESSNDLMDTVPGKELEQQVQNVLRKITDIQQIEETQAHRFGPYFVMNITIGIDGSLSVFEGDRIATQVELALSREIDWLQRVHVHYHPAHTMPRQD